LLAGGVRLLSDVDRRIEDRGCLSIDRFDETVALERDEFPYRGERAEHNFAGQTRQPVSSGISRVLESGRQRPGARGSIAAAQASSVCNQLREYAKPPTCLSEPEVT